MSSPFTPDVLVQGATQANLGGTLQLTGFAQGVPVFTVVPPPARSAPPPRAK
jgi:hypothetical protein